MSKPSERLLEIRAQVAQATSPEEKERIISTSGLRAGRLYRELHRNGLVKVTMQKKGPPPSPRLAAVIEQIDGDRSNAARIIRYSGLHPQQQQRLRHRYLE
ncbi:MAG TPA: hypothetical protein VEW42_06155 [Candidatus Eisenbacteria bacterium]|nr:hypothetical protein [Candidatus Eisenbacteria bacterium]